MNILQFILFIVYLLEAVNGLKCGSQITISMESPEKPFRTAKKDFKRAFPNVKHQFYVWAAQSKGGILCRVGKEDCFMHKDLICKVCENFNNDHYRHWFKWANETEDHDLKIGEFQTSIQTESLKNCFCTQQEPAFVRMKDNSISEPRLVLQPHLLR